MRKKLLVAIGGNSIVRSKTRMSVSDQMECIGETAKRLADLLSSGRYRLTVTHGSGPQVGNALVRSERGAQSGAPELPLDVIDAQVEGQLGYLIQQALQNELGRSAAAEECHVAGIVSLLTQVVVSADDDAFSEPTKPVGRFYARDEANELSERFGWSMREQRGSGGSDGCMWRRVVASPEPLRIVEQWAIDRLVDANGVVICLGGGGIPVAERDDGTLEGVAAVIDKDAASELLARSLDFDGICFSTGVPCAYTHFGDAERQRPIGRIDVDTAAQLLDDGHFGVGSMEPKIRAGVRFLRARSNRRVAITDPEHICAALSDSPSANVGTTIYS
jgi:carbamate kinase